MSADESKLRRSTPAEVDGEWDLSQIVLGLRSARSIRLEPSPQSRPRVPLPSRDALAVIMSGLRSALFPTHFGSADLTERSVDYFVGHTLDGTLRALQQQTRRTLLYEATEPPCDLEQLDRRAACLVGAFAARLPHVRAVLESDIEAAYEGDPAAKSRAEIMFCYPGVSAIINHRLAHELCKLGLTLLARVVAEGAHSSTGIDIHPSATIGDRFFIDHGTGVVIGETAVIGNHVRIYQGVTLGAKTFPTDAHGTLIKGLPRHPVIEDDVVIYAGATILGRVTIGQGSTIGGNVWLTRSVPPHSQVTQAQAHSESFDDGAGI
ncbi:MAG: Serine acetyltransferase [Myxococcaceae bacterium]|nr:Serine acetyltransferase [Myxococcaceae bacterium]